MSTEKSLHEQVATLTAENATLRKELEEARSNNNRANASFQKVLQLGTMVAAKIAVSESHEQSHEALIIEAQISTITALVPQIVADYDASTAAHEELLVAEAELLERVFAIARPAIRAIGDRPLVSSTSSGGRDGCNFRAEAVRADWRGICVSDDKTRPSRDTRGDDTQGTYGGTDLFLRADGTWCALTYAGTWARWQGAVSAWTTSAKSMTSIEVAHKYDADRIIGQISLAVTAAGSREKATARAKQLAEKLAAVVHLLGT